MSRTSEYTLDLVVKGDDVRNTIRALENELKGLGDKAKKATDTSGITDSLKNAQTAIGGMKHQMADMAKAMGGDFDSILKAYERNSAKAISQFEAQYAKLEAERKSKEGEYKRLQEELKSANHSADLLARTPGTNPEHSYALIAQIQERIKELGYEQLKAQIEQNRQVRANLADIRRQAMLEHEEAERQSKYDKLEELKAKRKAARGLAEKALLKQEIALQKAYIKQVEATEKAQKRNGDAIQSAISKTEKMAKAWEITRKVVETTFKGIGKIAKVGAGATQFAYNVSGMVGGAARTAKDVAGAGIGIAQQIGAGVSAVASGADQEVERERQANRIKGYDNPDERVDILRQIYVRTGADYSTIVDAIGRVQSILGKSLGKDELVSAAAIELRYPGMSQAFASSTIKADPSQFQRYANRMKAIQHATGASDEQIQASTQMMANMKPGDFGSASVTELQTVYLGLQNSGAFDSQEELDKAFRGFVRKQRDSGKNVFEMARDYNWSGHIFGERNRLQAQNTLQQMNWAEIGSALNKPDEKEKPEMSRAETMAMKMREIEDKKNQLLMKLIPAVLPVVEGIARLMDSKGESIVKGFTALFDTVIPLLDPVFRALDAFLGFMSRTILPGFQKLINVVVDWFGDEDNQNSNLPHHNIGNATPQNAAGGLAFMPSIVGERGPEAIIPLDYSRAQRAENIANTVNQTFNMGNSQTTALSLAQAVRSRDFTRAMTDNQFFTRRCGAF